MKNKIFLMLAFMITILSMKAQNNLGSSDDAARIPILAYVPNDMGDLTPTAAEALRTRLERIVTKAGLGGASSGERFILTAKIVELDKNISSTTPAIYYYNLEITLIIGDAIEGKMYSSIVFESKGSGSSETKAYLNAIKQLKDQDPKYTTFIDQAKNKIIEYYNSNCDFIIKDADALTSIKGYDQAIYKLASVPSVCKTCYEKCTDKIGVVYKAKMENECQTYISKATALMAQESYYEAAEVLSPILPDLSCYPKAQALMKDINDHKCATSIGKARGSWASHDVNATSEALASIPSDSKCYAEAVALANEVKKYVKDTENRDYEVMKQEQKDEVSIKKATIKAARDIGVAYGNGPKAKVVNYNIRAWLVR
jgi:hypothetical protein